MGTIYDAYALKQMTTIQAQLDAVNAVLLLIADDGNQSYKLDTGQTIQWVTKVDVDRLNTMVDSLLNRLATTEARLTGCGTVTARPAF